MDLTNLLTSLRATMRGYYSPLATKLTAMFNALQSHVSDTSNPHRVTKRDVDLENVENYAVATKQQAIDGISDNTYMTPRRTSQALDSSLSELAEIFERAADDLE